MSRSGGGQIQGLVPGDMLVPTLIPPHSFDEERIAMVAAGRSHTLAVTTRGSQSASHASTYTRMHACTKQLKEAIKGIQYAN